MLALKKRTKDFFILLIHNDCAEKRVGRREGEAEEREEEVKRKEGKRD